MNRNIIPEGTRDSVFKECIEKKRIIDSLEGIYESFGYDMVITPSIEYFNTFFERGNVLKEENLFKFFDSNGRILVLRPDMTIPIARVVGTKMRDIEPPIRLRYTANVFNVNKTFGGKKNEYTDCGVELIGVESFTGDIEVLILAIESLKKVSKSFKLEIGNIDLFNLAIANLQIDNEKKGILANLIESKSLIELTEFLNSLNIEEKYKEFFTQIPWLFGDVKILEKGETLAFNSGMKESLRYLKKLYLVLEELGYGEYISFDLGMVPRINYYTGIIFKGYVGGIGATVLNGGRYDNLIKSFDRNLRAVGFSINVDSVVEGSSLDLGKREETVITYGKNKLIEAIKESMKLREAGNRVRLNLSNRDDLINISRGEII